MISEQEKERIKSEELFRYEVRKEIESRRKKGVNFWEVLNSSFFLWFCSSVLISSFTFFFYNWQAEREAEKSRLARIEQIDLEIKSRLSFFHNQKKINNRVIEGLLILEKPILSAYPAGVYVEFNQRSLRSLLLELYSLVEDNNEKQELSIAVSKSEDLMKLYVTFTGKYKSQPSLDMKYQLLADLLILLANNFNLTRWDKPFGSDLKKEIQDLPFLQGLEKIGEDLGGDSDTLK